MSLRSFDVYLHNGAAATSVDPRDSRTPLSNALRKSWQDLSKPDSSPYDPTPMVTAVPALQNTFAQGQHDPEELLHHLIAILDDENKRPTAAKETGKAKEEKRTTSTTTQSSNEKEWEWDDIEQTRPGTGFAENPFAGRLVSKISCRGCKNERSQTHSFIDLSLAIPSGTEAKRPSLANCLDLFTKAEELTGVRCDRCIEHRREQRRHAVGRLASVGTHCEQIELAKRLVAETKSNTVTLKAPIGVLSVERWSTVIEKVLRAEKKLSIAKSPRALCLHIQRLVAQPGYRDTTFVKRNDQVEFPADLDLSDYCERKETPIKYKLAAVIVHHGSEDGGHFTVYRRLLTEAQNKRVTRPSPGEESDWVHISDEICHRVTEAKVLNAPAYMLFYEKDLNSSS
jgi:ubiquitin C-terminal hydrolase